MKTFVLLVLLSATAYAYPQFQLVRDQTCTACHLSPAGGNLLNENGLATSEAMSWKGTAPEFMYGKISLPSWLTLGGDFRGATGYLKTPENALATFPMQVELYGAATFAKNFSLHTNLGFRPSTVGNEGPTHVWAREHYFMWTQKPGENEGLYVRLGRFMPVIGLRLAEHTVYTRRYGGTALWSETYGAAVEYVTEKVEAHVTGFIKDPLIDSVEHYSGGAAYAEMRSSKTVALGAEGMVEVSKDDKRYRGGLTAKLYLPAADLLLQGEAQIVNQVIDSPDMRGAPISFVSYLMASRMVGEFVLVDLAFGHYDPSMHINSTHKGVAQDERTCVDLNVHMFATSHAELVLNTRYESIGFGKGGDPGAYAIAQLHYRP